MHGTGAKHMGERLTRIYTRTGDTGKTGLAEGTRLRKTAARIEALGAVDEVNSLLGLLLAESALPDTWRVAFTRVQHELFEIGAELALPGTTRIAPPLVARLENEMDAANATLGPLAEFILPGGSRPAALCHVARAVCRRAERRLWALAEAEPVNPESLRYLNRLSDYLFVAARALNHALGVADAYWQPQERTE